MKTNIAWGAAVIVAAAAGFFAGAVTPAKSKAGQGRGTRMRLHTRIRWMVVATDSPPSQMQKISTTTRVKVTCGQSVRMNQQPQRPAATAIRPAA